MIINKMSLYTFFKPSKKLFKNIVEYINKNKIILNETQHNNLTQLIMLWKNNAVNDDMNYYLSMKLNHQYLSQSFLTDELNELWEKYLLNFQQERVMYGLLEQRRAMTN